MHFKSLKIYNLKLEKDIILKAENISKQYRLGQVGTGTLAHDLNRWWHQIRGKENPYLKIGDTNDRSKKGTSDYVWALQDINFEVQRGEVLGIIGKNGAGKSTLLKLLSKVTAPTTGSIKSGGRIASLLEVGTGFNPELTGRENIFLNGAILGMTKKEIASKLNEIIEFSGCERYVDTPVKRYSSGMTVRLAFAVAAFLEPEILVVDEVLAVGDAEFQKKAIGKMQDISKTGGRTVLFVSHNMAAVKSLCTRGIVLENGKVKFDGDVDQALDNYLSINESTDSFILFDEKTVRSGSRNLEFISLEIRNQNNVLCQEFSIGDDLVISFKLQNNTKEVKSEVGIQIKSADELPIFHIMGRDSNFEINHNSFQEEYTVNLKDLRLYPGIYTITVISCTTTGHQIFDNIENALSFQIMDGGKYTFRNLPRSVGLFFLNPEWQKS
ncbi:ABC transporter ATP-binding protein [Flavobacterium hercynium]|uniref:ABC transporter ATP-binding protein n=1 Tax=Flavobacterium hercynium TaxID=387094 RepID=A0A226HD42_9FLAO|nr:ABC transporter ATP-binding protein [Flavobacterium hercynium]OXA92203.1 ABC transporter ATP-binding protein [Flavobacterium hercynium]SMP24385.1 lipopolysaccharide transport system ATP-binding protein [Flavobacterium hercynium]